MISKEVAAKALRDFLDQIEDTLELLKTKVGDAPAPDETWFANIPRTGEFKDIGITYFSRHGFGIYIERNSIKLDFDFIDPEIINDPKLQTTDKVLNIDPWKFYKYLESKGQTVQKATWKVVLAELVKEGVLVKKGSHYYFLADLQKIQLTTGKD